MPADELEVVDVIMNVDMEVDEEADNEMDKELDMDMADEEMDKRVELCWKVLKVEIIFGVVVEVKQENRLKENRNRNRRWMKLYKNG